MKTKNCCLLTFAAAVALTVPIYGQAAERRASSAERHVASNDPKSACERATEARIYHDGYHNVRVDWIEEGNSRNGKIAGTARALRGDNGQRFDFDVRCTIDLARGNIRSVEAKRR